MNAEFIDALRAIEKDREIPWQTLVETMEMALTSAYRRNYHDAADIKLRPDAKGKGLRPVAEKIVVETVENPHREVSLAEARRKNSQINVGDKMDVDVEVSPQIFGRIAAQTAKQVVVQKIREAEREKVFGEFSGKEGEIVTGVVQRREQGNVIVMIGKVEALLPRSEMVPGEPYRFNDRIKAYILEVRKTTKGPQVVLSRSHPSLIRRLFELEVPEISMGVVQIKNIAREPGARTKIAVSSTDDKVDPAGACIGHRGSRVQAVVNELYGEKIDIVRWRPDPAEFITESLSPAKVMHVIINEDAKSALVVVPDNQQSLAIGKEGQNVRLAARLTGWRIDIRSETQVRERELEEASASFSYSLEEG
jgi:transcription termination/antitermination protein NusA